MDINNVTINFSENSLTLLNYILAFLMFSVALDIKFQNIKDLLRQPYLGFIGIISQYILLPILSVAMVYAFSPPASIGLGMILIACCPGGSTSNYMVHTAKANSILSVMLTSITTIAAILVTPLSFEFWSGFINYANEVPKLIVEPLKMVKITFLLIFVPVSFGIFLNEYLIKFSNKIREPVRILSLVIFIAFVVGALYANWHFVKKYLFVVFWVVLVHNALAYAIGYYFARVSGLKPYSARAISIETGIQNTGLGLILVFNFFEGLGGMAMVLAWWGVWHLISGMTLAWWWRLKPV